MITKLCKNDLSICHVYLIIYNTNMLHGHFEDWDSFITVKKISAFKITFSSQFCAILAFMTNQLLSVQIVETLLQTFLILCVQSFDSINVLTDLIINALKILHFHWLIDLHVCYHGDNRMCTSYVKCNWYNNNNSSNNNNNNTKTSWMMEICQAIYLNLYMPIFTLICEQKMCYGSFCF